MPSVRGRIASIEVVENLAALRAAAWRLPLPSVRFRIPIQSDLTVIELNSKPQRNAYLQHRVERKAQQCGASIFCCAFTTRPSLVQPTQGVPLVAGERLDRYPSRLRQPQRGRHFRPTDKIKAAMFLPKPELSAATRIWRRAKGFTSTRLASPASRSGISGATTCEAAGDDCASEFGGRLGHVIAGELADHRRFRLQRDIPVTLSGGSWGVPLDGVQHSAIDSELAALRL